MHQFILFNQGAIPEIFAKAFYIAKSGRPGPVLVDIPKDLFMKEVEYADNTIINVVDWDTPVTIATVND